VLKAPWIGNRKTLRSSPRYFEIRWLPLYCRLSPPPLI